MCCVCIHACTQAKKCVRAGISTPRPGVGLYPNVMRTRPSRANSRTPTHSHDLPRTFPRSSSQRRRAENDVGESKAGDKAPKGSDSSSSSASAAAAAAATEAGDRTRRFREDWQVEEELAERMIPLIGKLYRRQNVIVTLFGDAIVNKSPNDILRMHETGKVTALLTGTPNPSHTLPP